LVNQEKCFSKFFSLLGVELGGFRPVWDVARPFGVLGLVFSLGSGAINLKIKLIADVG